MANPITPYLVTSSVEDLTFLTNALLLGGSSASSGILIDPATINVNASAPDAINIYDGSLAALGIGAGLLMTSGTTPGLDNTVGWFGQDNTGANGYNNGNAAIDAVVNAVFQTSSYDASTLSFSFTATDQTSQSVSFDIVFGSEEYPEWVDQFVDCAVVIVNGVNYAYFNHDPNSPLSVIGSNLANGYFQDNSGNVLPIEYDGVSHVLKIIAPINAGINTIEIGISDTGDHVYDSGIFISNLAAGNLPGNGVVITPDVPCTDSADTLVGTIKDEFIELKAGDDVAYAGGGDDIVMAGEGDDTVYGGSGNDVIEGDAGNDYLDGGDGISNTAVYKGQYSDYAVHYSAGTSTYRLNNTNGLEGIDTLKNIQLVKFNNGLYDLTTTGLTLHTDGVVTPPNSVGAVVLSGAATAGNSLQALVLDADGFTGIVDYQWQVLSGSSWLDTGVTTKNYDLTTADLGKTLKVLVSYIDANGNAESPISNAVLIPQVSTKLTISPMVIDAPAGASVMDPFTTLIKNAVALGMTPNQAEAAIKSAFGVDGAIDLASYNAYAILTSNLADTNALHFIKTEAQIAMTASVSDPTGINIALAALDYASNNQVIDLTNLNDIVSMGVGLSNATFAHGLNVDMADATSFNLATNSVVSVWNDWAGQKDNLKPFLNHLELISSHINQAPEGSAIEQLPNAVQAVDYIISDSSLLSGFTDPEGNTLSVINLTADQGGTISQNLDSTWTFVLNSDYVGPVELSYQVSDGLGGVINASQMLVVDASLIPIVNHSPIGTLSIVGSAIDGAVLSLVNTLADVDQIPLTGPCAMVYQWYSNNQEIVGANQSAYEIKTADIGKTITVSASYTDLGNTAESVLSQATNAVIAGLNLVGTSSANTLNGSEGSDKIDGLAGNDTINGAGGNDLITGGVGNDTMNGGSGSDLYLLALTADHAVAEIQDTGLTGSDEVRFTSTKASTLNLYAGDTGIETVVIGTGTAASAVTTGATANNINASLVANALSITGNNGNNTLTGTAYADTLTGNGGADTLNGGTGADTMIGGDGNDTYVVDNTGDVVTETNALTAGGTDLVQVAITTAGGTYTLGSNLENATLTNTVAYNLTGNSLNNTLTGNAANNTLDGSAGTDTLVGGAGNDTYLVDIITASGALEDTLTEASKAGTDTIQLRGTYSGALANLTLATNFENLDISATASSLYNLTGNTSNNVLTGNDANNTLSGGTGADALIGGLGNDTYVVDNVSDTVTEYADQGTDTIQSSVTFSLANFIESLTLTGTSAINGTGNTLDNTLTGNSGVNTLNGGDGNDSLSGLAGNDVLNGGGGNDILSGGAGSDNLTGGLGADHFVFDTALNATTNKDTITDFTHGTDKIDLQNLVMTALGGTEGALSTNQFWSGAGVVKGHDTDDRVVYNTTTGALYYDADGSGSGAAIQFAIIGATTHAALTYQDFLIV